jgi:hypothetical protein
MSVTANTGSRGAPRDSESGPAHTAEAVEGVDDLKAPGHDLTLGAAAGPSAYAHKDNRPVNQATGAAISCATMA